MHEQKNPQMKCLYPKHFPLTALSLRAWLRVGKTVGEEWGENALHVTLSPPMFVIMGGYGLQLQQACSPLGCHHGEADFSGTQ